MSTIAGVHVQPLRIISDERGAVLHMLRADSPTFDAFGEIYFSEVGAGMVKAWKRHQRATQRFAVPIGRIRLVVFDGREGSATAGNLEVIEIGRPDAYRLVVVPPMLWYGFASMNKQAALMANCTNLPHHRAESESLDIADAIGKIPYAWD